MGDDIVGVHLVRGVPEIEGGASGGKKGGGSSAISPEDGRVLTQAAIVRTLKKAGRMAHAELLDALTTALQPMLVPEPSLVRRCIEYLIDKEYIARHDADRDVYVYVP